MSEHHSLLRLGGDRVDASHEEAADHEDDESQDDLQQPGFHSPVSAGRGGNWRALSLQFG